MRSPSRSRCPPRDPRRNGRASVFEPRAADERELACDFLAGCDGPWRVARSDPAGSAAATTGAIPRLAWHLAAVGALRPTRSFYARTSGGFARTACAHRVRPLKSRSIPRRTYADWPDERIWDRDCARGSPRTTVGAARRSRSRERDSPCTQLVVEPNAARSRCSWRGTPRPSCRRRAPRGQLAVRRRGDVLRAPSTRLSYRHASGGARALQRACLEPRVARAGGLVGDEHLLHRGRTETRSRDQIDCARACLVCTLERRGAEPSRETNCA